MEASNFLLKLSKRLFLDTETQQKFVDALVNPHAFNLRILGCQPKPEILTTQPCYRIFPQDKLGAGTFTVLFQNTETGHKNQLSSDFLERTRLVSVEETM
jgi:hypothetical protein